MTNYKMTNDKTKRFESLSLDHLNFICHLNFVICHSVDICHYSSFFCILSMEIARPERSSMWIKAPHSRTSFLATVLCSGVCVRKRWMIGPFSAPITESQGQIGRAHV